MSRPIRIEFCGALYHVTSRGDRREAIYEDDQDRHIFLALLAKVIRQFNWCCHGYCLMGNHYHLLIETPDGNLSKGMRQLNGVYTKTSNRRHQRVGHLFQGRYKAILVDADSYLLELTRMETVTKIVFAIQVVFITSVLYGFIAGRTFIIGRWIYRSEGLLYWMAICTQIIILSMSIFAFGWVVLDGLPR